MVEIARSLMPQIDERDIPRLIVYASKMDIGVTAGEVWPNTFTRYQEVNWDKVKAMADHVLDKPILCTRSWEVIDGNHRNAAHELRKTFNPFIKFNCTMSQAMNMLAVFPFAYELTELTPERH